MRVKPESLKIISWESRASNLIVLVESEIKQTIAQKNNEKRELEAIFMKLPLAIYRAIDSE